MSKDDTVNWNHAVPLDAMLEDTDVMTPVLQSAGLDHETFRDMMTDTARRLEARKTSGADSGHDNE